MKSPILQLSFFIFLFAFANSAEAQFYSITGQVIDESSSRPVEFATIVIYNRVDDKMLTGVTTDLDGKFEASVEEKDVKLEISFIGYQNRLIEQVEFVDGTAQLGKLTLSQDAQTLEEVVVRAEKSTTEFRLDKRVFNVGQDLSTSGASAFEVLNNVPSVNVNIEGEVTLRGAGGVQILINGKPSVLTNEQGNALGTITAEMIEKVEVITNPSAKYEAEGTSGIINIVLKKEEKRGINGSISLNTGIPDNHSVGISLNRRTEKLNLFTQLGAGYRSFPRDRRNINRNNATNTEILAEGEEFRNEGFYNLILGADYYINENNIITLSGSAALELEDQPSATFFEVFENGNLVQSWDRTEVTEATNPKYQYELQYKRNFTDDEDHQLLFSAIGNFFGKDQSSEFFNDIILGSGIVERQETATNFMEGKYTFNIDYTKPISDEVTIEVGSQYVWNDVSNDFEVADIVDGESVINPGLTNLFEYNQKVLGVYGTSAYEGDVWGIKAGLRVENTDLSTLLVNTNEDNNQKFTNFFPSFAASYKFSDALSIQSSYSRRIFRPRLWDLNPFFNIRNNFSLWTGNPNLLPEYTDSYEVGGIYIMEKSTVSVTVFHRYTSDVVDRIATFEDNVSLTMPFNIGTRNSTGVDFNFKYTPMDKWTLTGDANYNIFVRNGQLNDQTFDFDASQYSGKLTSKVKFNKQFEMEATGRYNSSVQTIQGEVADNLFADLGARYKILNGRGVLNLSVRDIFASRIRESFAVQGDFFSFGRSLRGRFITLGFSFGFGKGEAMQYSSGRRR
jgi:outer membrane receptor protein involved in Fe transport